jgi:hypothetical protein
MVLPFEEVDSDSDSISVTSTRSSDPEAEYNVEKILAEEVWDDGVKRYLLKWEGYPLHSATWEPTENIIGAQLLSNWEREQAEIKAGVRSPFDVLEHEKAQEDHIAEKAERHRRRKAKRRKRGLAVSRSGSISNGSANDVAMRDGDQDSAGDEPPAAARSKRVKTTIPKRKGVALKVRKNSNRQAAAAASSSEEDSEDEMATSDESLLEETRTQQAANTSGRRLPSAISGAVAPPTPSRARGGGTAASPVNAANRVTKSAPSKQKPASARRTTASSSSANTRSTAHTLPSSSARKSAPSTASFGPATATMSTRPPVLPTDPPVRKSTGTVSMTLKPASSPRTRRMSESNPRQQRFANLSEQNRVHKHSRKEAAPDPDMLGTWNPVTGGWDEPVARALTSASRVAGGASMTVMPSVFGRREAPAPARTRSPSPVSPKILPASASSGDNTTVYTKVCWDWRNSTCTKPAGTCTFAHHYITCPHWKSGGCNKSERDCVFDHREGRDPIRREQAFSAPTAFPQSGIPARQPQQSPIHQISGASPPHVVPPQEEVHTTLARGSVAGAPERRPTMTNSAEPTALYLKDIVCRDWRRGHCSWGHNCRQAHQETGLDIGLKDVICSFWAAGHCNRRDMCVFAHRHTEYRAGPPHSGLIYFEPRTADASSEPKPRALPETTEARRSSISHVQPLSQKQITCYFWLNNNGDCSKGDGCWYAHHLTEWHANLPKIGGFKHVPFAPDTSRNSKTPLLNDAGAHRQSLHGSRPANAASDDMTITDDGHAESAPATFSIAVPVSRKASIQKNNSEPSPAHDVNPKIVPNDTLPSGILANASEDRMIGTLSKPASSATTEDLLRENMERLLKISDVKMEERVYIMMPESRASEMQLIAKMFEERFKQTDYKDRHCKIWTSAEPKDWDACLKTSACLLLVHPDVPLWDVPSLGRVLHTSAFRVFSINFDLASATLDRSDPEFSCQRLFPMGDVIFLTDEVFIHKPGKVLAIIEKVNNVNRNKPLGATRNKIATRPGIRLWLADLVVKQTEGSEDPRLLMLLNEIWNLCPIDKEDDRYPGNPSEDSDLISLAPEQLPTFQILLQTDRARATDYIVNWFAGWSFMNASKYRRFTVCHEEPGTGKQVMDKRTYDLVIQGEADPRGWGEAFKYLLVETPDQYIAKEEAKDKAKSRAAERS